MKENEEMTLEEKFNLMCEALSISPEKLYHGILHVMYHFEEIALSISFTPIKITVYPN